jgi:phosphoserine phosphatase
VSARAEGDRLTAAIIYDFDGTLAPGNLQEHKFIPEVGQSKEDFWADIKAETRRENADEILVYMRQMILKADNFTRDQLADHGKGIELFPGLRDGSWFERMNEFGRKEGLDVKHFIVSSGLKEMIEATEIARHFEYIYASEFIFDENGYACWPKVAINYTTKTQYLFRINKGIENHWDDEAVNRWMPEHERPVPFERMIFIGDGATDIPTMKMMTQRGGHSIAVYPPSEDRGGYDKIHRLIAENRVNFVAKADYAEHSTLDITVRGILARMALFEELTDRERSKQ